MGIFSLNHSRGFSLTELSAAIAIIAVIAGSAISVGITSDEAAKIKQTELKMNAIEDALGAYFAINKRLPCPAEPHWAGTPANFAVESISSGSNPETCTGAGGFDFSGAWGVSVRYGTLPARSLQLPQEYYVDGWGRPFTYVVDTRFANNTTTNALCDGSGGNGDDEDACALHSSVGAITVTAGATAGTRSASVYVMLSHGANGHGAYFANGIGAGAEADRFDGVGSGRTLSYDELENVHLEADGSEGAGVDVMDAEFVQKAYVRDESAGGEIFDDIVRFFTREQLIRKAGATLFQGECVTAAAILDSPGSNACTSAANAPVCELFAQEIDGLCLQ